MYSMKRNETAEHWCRRIAGIVCLAGAFVAPALALPEKEGVTLSPDGQLSVTLHEPQGGAEGFALSLKCGEKEVFRRISLGLTTDRDAWTEGVTLRAASAPKEFTEDYRMKVGKRLHCVNRGNERTYSLANAGGRVLDIILRVYDDGVAFRYVLQSEPGEQVVRENTSYDLADGRRRWLQTHVMGSEGFYDLYSDGTKTGAWGYPALMEPADSLFVLLTESGVGRGNCGAYLENTKGHTQYEVALIDRAVPAEGTWTSPWRVSIVGSLADVVESTLVTDVAEPSRLEDTDWIRPGSASWIYWAYNHGTRDYKLLADYIDLAAEMKWPYTLVDWEWDSMGNGGTIDDVFDYARRKEVEVLLWYNSSTAWVAESVTPLYRLNAPDDREKEFSWLEREGVRGVKIDFFPDDSLWVTNYYIDLLEAAARHRILVNFHGGTIPKGWQRTYPNLVTYEAVYGAEWYNNNNVLTDRAARHNATLPFTRNVIGSMDYTPGTFSNSQHPHITTYAHELALPVLFESGVLHMPDRPSVYRGLPDEVKRLLSELPTAWDETRLLAGNPGESVVLARRKGTTWYIAGINGTDEPATLAFSLQRLALSKSPASVRVFEDGEDGQSFRVKDARLMGNAGERLAMKTLPRGGFVMVVSL